MVHFVFEEPKDKIPTSISCLLKKKQLLKEDPLFLLDGSSHDTNRLIRQGAFSTDRRKQAEKYLKFYCAYVWGNDKAFHILKSDTQIYNITDEIREELKQLEDEENNTSKNIITDKKHKFKNIGLFGDELYRFTFEVGYHGEVSMVQDEKIPGYYIEPKHHEYNTEVFTDKNSNGSCVCNLKTTTCKYRNKYKFFKSVCRTTGANCRLLKKMDKLIEKERKRRKQLDSENDVKRKSSDNDSEKLNNINRVDIDLTRARIGALNDQSGHAWKNHVRLFLEGFTYTHLSRPERATMDKVYKRLAYLTATPTLGFRFYRFLMPISLAFDKLFPRLISKHLSTPLVALLYLILLLITPIATIWFYFKAMIRALKRFFFTDERMVPPEVMGKYSDVTLSRMQWFLGRDRYDKESKDDLFWYFIKPWRWRKNWLMLQYRYYYPTGIEFTPQPFRQLEKVYHAQGQSEDARQTALLRLKFERKQKPWYMRGLLWPYQKFFGFGLSPVKAFITLLIWWGLGAWGVDALNEKHLFVDSIPTATIVVDKPNKNELPLTEVIMGASREQSNAETTYIGEVACGDSINPWVYALDVMIPLVDFRQEFRCHIKSKSEKIPGKGWDYFLNLFCQQLKTPKLYLHLKALYTIFGWLITSLTILTITGILRRQAETTKSDEPLI